MATKSKSEPMCAVTIGFNTYLMPASVGMKMVNLLQSVVECEDRYLERDWKYVAGDQVRVEYRSVRHDQIKVQAQTLMLEHK